MSGDLNAEQTSSIIRLQSFFRTQLVKKQFTIKPYHCSTDEKDYLAHILGNDPLFETDPSYLKDIKSVNDQGNHKIALLGVGGFRNLSVACGLKSEMTPKIIIIDTAPKVCNLWYQLRDFITDNPQFETNFYEKLQDLLITHKTLYQKTTKLEKIITFFEDLITQHGYEKIRKLICHASIINQSLADKNTIKKINTILNYLTIDKICVYASNVLACIPDPKVREQIQDNIKLLKPALSVHTDECRSHGTPHHTYVLVDEQHNQRCNYDIVFWSKRCPIDPSPWSRDQLIFSRYLNEETENGYSRSKHSAQPEKDLVEKYNISIS